MMESTTLNGRLLWILYRHELRSSLRARSIVVSSLLIPVVMYPLIMWVVFAGVTFVQGQREAQEVRIVVVGGEDAPNLMAALEDLPRSVVTPIPSDEEARRARAREDLLRGSVDVILSFERLGDDLGHLGDPGDLSAAPNDAPVRVSNWRAHLEIHEGLGRSREAETRLREAFATLRTETITRARQDLGIDEARWRAFGVVRADQSTPEDRTRLLLSLLVPLFTVLIVALASFYPAIDTTAGERERSTWETLMTLSVSRRTVVWAKFLHVATLGAVGGLLNLAALALSLQWILSPLMGDATDELAGTGLSLEVLPVIVAGTALLALLVAALMLVFTVFARTFKEGQAMVTPVYMLLILPPVAFIQPDMEATIPLAMIPLVNTVLLLRDGLLGELTPLLTLTALGSMLVTALLATAFAQWVMGREEVLAGATQGGLVPFLRRTLGRRDAQAPDAPSSIPHP